MKAVTRAIAMRFLGERGGTAVEYALLTAVIALAIVGTGYFLGFSLSFVIQGAANSVATAGPGAPPPPQGTGRPPGPYYDDCDAARADGAAPIHVGDPGYSPQLDPDGDGVGCE